jgi:hypothetical protein
MRNDVRYALRQMRRWLDDLANYPDDEVRVMAANALASYVDDPAVRAAMEQAESERSFAGRSDRSRTNDDGGKLLTA